MTYGAERVELHNLSSNRAEHATADESKAQSEIVAPLSKLALDWYATLPTEADPSCLSKPMASPSPTPRPGRLRIKSANSQAMKM